VVLDPRRISDEEDATTVKKSLMIVAALCCALIASQAPAERGEHDDGDDGPGKRLTLAVFGDWPYSLDLVAAAPLLLDSINSDPSVSLVLHVGDIHSGSMPCTGAGLRPLPAGSNPAWNLAIFALFDHFKDPVVYTPGDNEWTDCHKKKQFSSGAPLNELASVRSLFFPSPGSTLGGRKMGVLSQAQMRDPAHPADAQFVENVMWQQSQTVFVTLNVPGSNNDGLPWTAPFTDEPARQLEVAERTAADLRWLELAFAWANRERARAVVIGLQADMWDPAAVAPGGDGLDGYTAFVRRLAELCLHFGRPVLLFNGDSHLFEADRPLADPSSATGLIHGTPPVPNLTRITVQGSTNKPREWLRLTIDPRSPAVFSWENVVYCDDTTCPN
jgi:hypothetical protein